MAVTTSHVAGLVPQLFSRLGKQIYDLRVTEKIFGLLALLVASTGFLAATSFQSVRLQTAYRHQLATSASAAANIERVNALTYAVVMESRGIYASTGPAELKRFSEGLFTFSRELAGVIAEWKTVVQDDDLDQFLALKRHLEQFVDDRRELAQRAVEIGPTAAREGRDRERNRNFRKGLNGELEALAMVYKKRAQEAADLADLNRYASWYLFALSIVTFMIAALVVLVTRKFVTGPLSDISSATDRVVAGKIELKIPHVDRQDEMGYLARALENFRDVVRRNIELAEQHGAAVQQSDTLNDKFIKAKWQLRAALNNMPQGLVMINSRGKILVANARYREIYQLPPGLLEEDCTLANVLKYLAKKGRFVDDVQATIDAILARIAKGERGTVEYSLPDGRVIRISEQPMDGGCWVSTHEDVTEQRRAERHLLQTKRFLATIVESVKVAIVAKDARDLRYVFVNKAAEKLFGLPRAEIIGKTARDLFPSESAELIERLDGALLSDDQDIEVAVRSLETPNNGRRSVLVRKFRIAGDNDSHVFLGLFEDKTDEISAVQAA
jgi:PAS domain S-box-containing protein